MAFLIALTLIFTQTQAPALRVVVLEGEDAVNIVQQKTAVRPLVEVRDRNNLPVPGASVTFTVGAGQPAAFGGGAQTVTVTTNASGQAAPASFSATGAGKVSIQVQAAHQGQLASAAITQTNFVTVAAATAAGVTATTAGAAAGTTGGAGAAGAAGVTGAAGAGAGGGISMTTIAIVGGAVAGGAVVAQQTGVLGGGKVTYTGSVNGQYVWTNSGRTDIGTAVVCAFTRSIGGTVTMELNEDGTSGRAAVSTTHTDLSVTAIAGGFCNFNPQTRQHGAEVQVSGGPSALSFSHSETGTGTNQNATIRFSFNGSLAGNTITGSLTFQTEGQTTSPSGPFTSSASTTIPVTLQR